MPTASKLVAALLFAALAWICADLIKPLLREGTQVGLFSPISAGFGLLVGWVFTGARLGNGKGSPVGIGLTSAVLMAFWVLFAFASYEMLRRSLRKSYSDPSEALQDVVQIAVDYLQMAAVPEVIGALVVGGAIGGWLTGVVSRRWS